MKAHPPNWQHGRVLYAAARRYLAEHPQAAYRFVDVGTAKGFSALCLAWALIDAGCHGAILTIDVIDPAARVRRNTVAEVEGYRTLQETLAPWWQDFDRAGWAEFHCGDAGPWLERLDGLVDVAFVDGKHTEAAVSRELWALSQRQSPGAVVIVDDLQIPGVRAAVQRTHGYAFERIALTDDRIYAVGIRC